MRIVFRADASLTIGSGHVLRCLTLADLLRQGGAEVLFLCREHPGHLIGLIEGKGYPVLRLPRVPAPCPAQPGDPVHAPWLGASWQQDAAASAALLAGSGGDWLVLDHYALELRWEQALRPRFRRIMVIDDLADRGHDCELLLDQNLGRAAADYRPLVPERCTVLAGPGHSLLRPEFAALRDYSLKRREMPRLGQLLVTMGGVDKDNASGAVLAALKGCPLPDDCRITVVLGGAAPWLDQVRAGAQALNREVEVLVEVADMARLMAQSDLAIGAAGGTSWERCCLGVPTLMLVLAQNQELAARELAQAGAALVLERHWQPGQLQELLRTLICQPEALRRMSLCAARVTDGSGASSVLKYLAM